MGREGFWDMITAGRTATRRISFFDPSRFRSQVAAEVDFDGRAQGLTAHEVFRNDRFVQMAMVAADEAVADSGLTLGAGGADDAPDPDRVGVKIGRAHV